MGRFFAVFCALVLVSSSAFGFSLLGGDDQPNVKKNKGDFLLAKAPESVVPGAFLILSGETFNAVGGVNIEKLGAIIFTGWEKVPELEYKFKDQSQMKGWLDSTFPGYRCLTEYGIEVCK